MRLVLFFEGYVKVRIGDKYGYIDKIGKVVIDIKYDNIYGFPDDLIVVKKDGKYGCMDKSEKVVIPLIYDDIYTLTDGLLEVHKDKK